MKSVVVLYGILYNSYKFIRYCHCEIPNKLPLYSLVKNFDATQNILMCMPNS